MLPLRQADVKLVETARFSSCEFSDRNLIYHKHSILRPVAEEVELVLGDSGGSEGREPEYVALK